MIFMNFFFEILNENASFFTIRQPSTPPGTSPIMGTLKTLQPGSQDVQFIPDPPGAQYGILANRINFRFELTTFIFIYCTASFYPDSQPLVFTPKQGTQPTATFGPSDKSQLPPLPTPGVIVPRVPGGAQPHGILSDQYGYQIFERPK
jgi:hypothetical protein